MNASWMLLLASGPEVIAIFTTVSNAMTYAENHAERALAWNSLDGVSGKCWEDEDRDYLIRPTWLDPVPEDPELTPIPKDEMNLDPLINCCFLHMKSISESGRADSDDKQYIYEAAMIAVFGRDYFDWHNARTP